MSSSGDPQAWRAKALRFRTEALQTENEAFAERLLRAAEGCERTAVGLAELDHSHRRLQRVRWRTLRRALLRRRRLRDAA
jgi:hypothetical protein